MQLLLKSNQASKQKTCTLIQRQTTLKELTHLKVLLVQLTLFIPSSVTLQHPAMLREFKAGHACARKQRVSSVRGSTRAKCSSWRSVNLVKNFWKTWSSTSQQPDALKHCRLDCLAKYENKNYQVTPFLDHCNMLSMKSVAKILMHEICSEKTIMIIQSNLVLSINRDSKSCTLPDETLLLPSRLESTMDSWQGVKYEVSCSSQ